MEVSYGPEPDQLYEIRVPDAPIGATVLLVHGGFWRPRYDRAHTAPQANALADNGFHVATVEYRRLSHGGWRATRDDILAATSAVRADTRLPDQLVTMGHSAGGHLVLWLQHQQVAHGLAGTIALAPCADLHLTYDLNLGSGAALALMGAPPQQDPAAWRAADPACLGAAQTPTHILHGDRDDDVPLEVSQAYVGAVPGVPLTVLRTADHYDLITPASPHFARVLESARAVTC